MDEEFISPKELANKLRISIRSLYKFAGTTLPAPVRVGPNTLRFRRSDVEEWLRKSIQERQEAGLPAS